MPFGKELSHLIEEQINRTVTGNTSPGGGGGAGRSVSDESRIALLEANLQRLAEKFAAFISANKKNKRNIVDYGLEVIALHDMRLAVAAGRAIFIEQDEPLEVPYTYLQMSAATTRQMRYIYLNNMGVVLESTTDPTNIGQGYIPLAVVDIWSNSSEITQDKIKDLRPRAGLEDGGAAQGKAQSQLIGNVTLHSPDTGNDSFIVSAANPAGLKVNVTAGRALVEGEIVDAEGGVLDLSNHRNVIKEFLGLSDGIKKQYNLYHHTVTNVVAYVNDIATAVTVDGGIGVVTFSTPPPAGAKLNVSYTVSGNYMLVFVIEKTQTKDGHTFGVIGWKLGSNRNSTQPPVLASYQHAIAKIDMSSSLTAITNSIIDNSYEIKNINQEDLQRGGKLTGSSIAQEAITGQHIQPQTITGLNIAVDAISGQHIAVEAVAGVNIAPNTITGDRIVADAITADKVAAKAITGEKIAANTVSGQNIAIETIAGLNIAPNAITGDKIIANAITADKVAANAITSDKVAANTIKASHIIASAVTGDKLAATTITGDKVAANAITGDKIVANAITADKVAVNAITSDKVAANTIRASHIIASSITGDRLAANTITGDKVAANTITGDKIVASAITADKVAANAITSDKVAANTITSSHIIASAITGDKLAANTITGDKVAANTITGDKIVASAITADKVAANAITSDKVAANTIKASHIIASSITGDRLAANTITGDKLVVNTITGDKVAAGTITGDKIIAGGIDSANIKTGAIQASHLAAGAITAEKIAAGAITAGMIQGGSITADKFESTTWGDMSQAMRFVKSILGGQQAWKKVLSQTDLNAGVKSNITVLTEAFPSIRLDTQRHWDDGSLWDSGSWDIPVYASGYWESASVDYGAISNLQAEFWAKPLLNDPTVLITVKARYSNDNITWTAYETLTGNTAFDYLYWTGSLQQFRYFKVRVEFATINTNKYALLAYPEVRAANCQVGTEDISDSSITIAKLAPELRSRLGL